MDMYIHTGKLIVFISMIGMASALECIACNWNTKNSSREDDCLGAPFKSETVVCPESNSPGERIVCQTLAVFNKKSGDSDLERLERKCGSKHSKCDNACADDTSQCWLCCTDDKCNGFPLSANIVVTTSTANGLNFFFSAVVLATVSVVLSLV
ncbi:uncharacterized protein LOC123559794 [Mercenaria mercenaria]|uniref:uncharacterized protein LOC123559794 n=1 Tax=Mercenaria mercenaria TaxID=6596 RepID=UPI001E1D86B7|nr:uncharacterized protein LOC123559794 [Mercenaria mercenaria]